MDLPRYEVSDGAVGTCTITGYFCSPTLAYAAFEAAHGPHARGVALVYRLDADDEVYAVGEDGSLAPVRGEVHDVHDVHHAHDHFASLPFRESVKFTILHNMLHMPNFPHEDIVDYVKYNMIGKLES